MTDSDVLNIPSIVIRRLPEVVVSRWHQYVMHHGEPKPDTETRTIIKGPDETGLYIVEERRSVSPELAGKFMVTIKPDTGSTVHFNRKYDGIGDTISEAYKNYLKGV